MTTPALSSSSLVSSRDARAQPTAIAATSGRVLSKVAIAPANPCLTSISGLPSRFSFGTRQSSKRIVAVSEERMPSLCSRRSTFIPGVPLGTTKDLIAARPRLLSRVAHTTTASHRSPAVTKIFSPLRTYSSPSSTAVVWMLAESEPVPGSVIAMLAHRPSKRLCCSSSATEAMAELPRPWRGIDSSRPTSPQHISMMERTEARLEPFFVPAAASSDVPSSRRTPDAPAPLAAPDSLSPSIIAASMSSSLGYSCSSWSYLRELGRSRFIATWCAWPISGRNFLGVSRLIMMASSRRDGVWAEWTGRRSDEDPSFHDTDGAKVAVPPLDGVLLDEAVTAEQLDPVVPDLHATLGAQLASQGDLAVERLALRGAGSGLVGHQPHRLEL